MPFTLVDELSRFGDFGVPFAPEITELSLARTGGKTWVFGHTNDPDTGFITMEMAADGDLSVVSFVEVFGESATYTPYDQDDPSGFGTVTLGGTFYLVGSNKLDVGGASENNGLHFYTISSSGIITLETYFTRGALAEQEVQGLNIDGNALLFEIGTNANGVYRDLTVIDLSTAFGVSGTERVFRPTSFAEAEVNAVGEIDGEAFFFYARADNQDISWMSFTSSGTGLFRGDISGSGQGAGTAPTDMALIAFDNDLGGLFNDHYLITLNPEVGLRSFDVDNIALMRSVDSVDTDNGFASWVSEQFATFSVDGRQFVVTSGRDLTVFEISKDGDFFLADQITNARGPLGEGDIEVEVRDGTALIIVNDGFGLSTYSYTVGPAQDQVGTAAGETLTGDARDNTIDGAGGNDRLVGLGGADLLEGGAGKDTILGGAGSDDLYGGGGNDRLVGGGSGDYMNGGGGADVLIGGASYDNLYGRAGKDTLNGGAGDDDLFGGDSNDRLLGGKGKDDLAGDAGADYLAGGKGNDKLIGGSQGDTFVFAADNSVDRVLDWQGNDTIALTGFDAGTRWRDIDIIEKNNGSLELRLDGEKMIVSGARDLRARDLSGDDFDFV